jgi:hypothetical protein
VYEGEWRKNLYHGKGTYTFASGAKYVGDWVDHRMHGIGVFTDDNKAEWSGIYINGHYDSMDQIRLSQDRSVSERMTTAETSAKGYLKSLVSIFDEE